MPSKKTKPKKKRIIDEEGQMKTVPVGAVKRRLAKNATKGKGK